MQISNLSIISMKSYHRILSQKDGIYNCELSGLKDLIQILFFVGPLKDFTSRSQDLLGAFTCHFLGAAFLSFVQLFIGPLLILAVEPRLLSAKFCFQTMQHRLFFFHFPERQYGLCLPLGIQAFRQIKLKTLRSKL